MDKKCKVVMLPTNEKAKIQRINSLYIQGTDKLFPPNVPDMKELGFVNPNKNQHLYIISDDEIKECDWFINNNGVWQHNGKIEPNGGARKVVASTDSNLKFKRLVDCDSSVGNVIHTISMPSPSQSFIDKYISEYNKGNKLEEVLVEYDEVYRDATKDRWGYDLVLKVNPKDNTITIKRTKDSWTRDEVISLMEFALEVGFDLSKDPLPRLTDISGKGYLAKWIESNL